MTKNVSQRDKQPPAHIQRAIDADVKLRKQAQQSVNWPDPKARKKSTARYILGPVHVMRGSMAEKIAQAAALEQSRASTQAAE